MRRKKIGRVAAFIMVFGVTVVFAALSFASGSPPAGNRQQNPPVARQNMRPDFMGLAGISGWVLSGTPRVFSEQALYGYIDGASEIFLQYGFRGLWVYRFVPSQSSSKGKEITLELFRMASPAAAFGIFSTRREGNEPVSARLRTIHWLGAEQANLVKGNLYANVLATGCSQGEIEDFVLSLDRELPPAEAFVPPGLAMMPEFNIVPRTERYILGVQAAVNESPLLAADFWGFKEGLTEAYSAKYGPGASKLVLIHFKQPPDDLAGKVYRLFEEHAMKVSMSDNIVRGGSAVGGSYYFGGSGGTGVLVLDEPDPKVARARIQEALKKEAERLREKK